jgi:predicted Holliday junction resolvase-like endonuclease
MEVIFLLVLLIGGIIYHFKSHYSLSKEVSTLDHLLRETLDEHERKLQDHKEHTQELAITTAKLESLKLSTFTPDNSVPKHLHAEKVFELYSELNSVRTQLASMTSQFEESRGKQISSRVRLGQIGENFSCLHDSFKYDRKATRAILQPIDFVCFEEDEVIFIEVKTGEAQLSTKQRRIRDNIKAGRVKFEVFRFDENGAHWE